MTGDHAAGVVEADVVVLGAGISGLVGASTLLKQGCPSVRVVDEYDGVGGNHINVEIGHYTYDIGSLIFQDDSPLLDHFPELLEHYLPVVPRWSRLNPQGVVTAYPMSLRDDLLAAGPMGLTRTVGSALVGRLDPRPMRTARDYARRSVGTRFMRTSGLEHYMERFCGCPIDEIELEFAQSRMAWVADQTRPRAVIDRVGRAVLRAAPLATTNRQLVRPRAGFEALYEPAVANLTSRGAQFALGRPLQALRRSSRGWEIETADGTVHARRVVSTIPLQRALRLLGLEPPPLPTVTLLSLFLSFEGRRGFTDPILYNFSRVAQWKRMTIHSDFYGAAGGREYLTIEVVTSQGGVIDPAVSYAEFRAHVAEAGLFVGDLRLEGHHVLEHAYPVYTQGSGARAAAARARLQRAGIDSFGRQGAFQYQPTARASTLEAEAALGARRSEVAT